MGSTIRRQPITSKIPNSPDYKYLNLTTFAGLHQTDNPFTVNPNTASDVLNVYIDEQNTLTTRPRIANKTDLSEISGEIISSYRLGDKTYFKFKENGIVDLYDNEGSLLKRKKDISINSGEFSMINYNGTLILLDGNQILVFENDEWIPANEWKDLPIPLTTTNKSALNPEGISFEPANMLTTKHREAYNLSYTSTKTEGEALVPYQTTNINFIGQEMAKNNAELYENKSLKEIYVHETHEGALHHGDNVIFDDDTAVFLDVDYSEVNPRPVIREIKLYGDSVEVKNDVVFDFSTSTPIIESAAQKQHVFIIGDLVNDFKKIVFGKHNGTEYQWETQNITPFEGEMSKGYMSPDGKYAIFVRAKELKVYKSKEQASSYEEYKTLTVPEMTTDYIQGIAISNNNTIYIGHSYNTIIANDLSAKDSSFSTIYTDEKGFLGGGLKIDRTGSYLFVNNGETYLDLSSEVVTKKELLSRVKIKNYPILSQPISNLTLIPTDSLDLLYLTDRLSNKAYMLAETHTEDVFLIPMSNVDCAAGDGSLKISKDLNYIIFQENNTLDWKIFKQTLRSSTPSYEILVDEKKELPEINLTKTLIFDNVFWFYSTSSNIVRWNNGDNPLYIPKGHYDEVGDNEPMVAALIIDENSLGLFKKNKTYTATPGTVNDTYTYLLTEITNDYGCYSNEGAIISPLNNLPIVVNENEISGMYSSTNIGKVNRYFTSLSLPIDKKYRQTDVDKKGIVKRLFIPEKIIAKSFKYWSIFSCNHDNRANVLVYDDRTGEWFYWEVPSKIDYLWVDKNKLCFISYDDKKIRSFETSDLINPHGLDLTEYYDLDRKLIKWHWTSQILPLGTINYYKKLVDTTFIVADTDANDSYGLNYTFKAYRKHVSESDLTTVKNEIQYVQSVTKKTLISRFNFLQFEISQTEDDQKLSNNKLRLIGMALKYALLGGIMQ